MSPHTLFTASCNFESARQVGLLPSGHKAHGLHGHSFLAKIRADLPAAWAPFPGAEVHTLGERLAACTGQLDYRLINEVLGSQAPTDENIARWLRDQLVSQQGVPGLEQVGIQSTADQGVDLDRHDQAHVWRRYRFQSAHKLPNVPIGHKCGRLHGHGFEVIVHANQDAGGRDISIDYDHLDEIWAPFHYQLNHKYLNAIEGLSNPTSEVIAAWLWDRLKAVLPELSWVTVYETGSCGANFNGSAYRIWKEMTLDSALFLRHAPDSDPLSHIHGHTYTLRLHLSAPLDEVMGWTVDFGDVKDRFNPIFKALDHHPLHELPGLDDCDAASLAQWGLAQGRRSLPQLDRVDLYETRGCGAIALCDQEGPALPV
ncbi:MAG: 6-carboxytetrahydropterin synthase [Aquabacterium sp.]|uniref:6-carboxytetrahydropterin synthase n=1 Tax=Aquabacterium sp. TaxID=1872578 RepID=UPI0025C26D1D|nr:6-carboxytetrahydropterin synthase [Aquabacterium sp.]MBI3380605.1 6-carboxytetrahydropterin synthase [Aquabacterium sp.]